METRINGRKRGLEHDGNERPSKRRRMNNHNGRHDMDAKENGLELLKEVCPFIHFGLMNGKYFISKVKPLKCLNDKDMIDILSYYQDRNGKCGRFSVKERGQKYRKKLEGDCPICMEEVDNTEDTVWCRNCGNSVHADCFKEWERNSIRSGFDEETICMFCRGKWMNYCANDTRND